MAEMVKIAEIAKRLNLDGGTIRRLIARESEELGLVPMRGKADVLLLPERMPISSSPATRHDVAQ